MRASSAQLSHVYEANACGLYSGAFIGAYAVEYIRQQRQEVWHIQKAVAQGCKAVARTIEQVGAQDSLPWAEEIDPR